MIYAGLFNFTEGALKPDDLLNALRSFTHTAPTIAKKKSLVVCYGKQSKEQDLDDAWENEAALLLGRIFDKHQHCAFNKRDFQGAAHLDKSDLLEKFWGKYVYLNTNEKGSVLDVVVDSTGQLPFFYYPFPDGNILFSSDIEIIYKILQVNPQFNWDYLCSYLIYGNSSSIITPFQNIYELPPACQLTITKNERRTTPFWNPLSSYKNTDRQVTDAVSVLRTTLKAWTEPYKNICVSLSGGLDSSSLTYCLKDLVRKDQNLKALNYFHSQIQSSNELVHARKVCQETEVDLLEIDVSDALPFDLSRNKLPLKVNKPFPGLLSTRWLEVISDHIFSNGSCAFVSGHGSDHIFMRPPSKQSFADSVLEKGLKGSKGVLEGVAHFYRDTLFSILKENGKSLIGHTLGKKKEQMSTKNGAKDIPEWIRQEAIQNVTNSFSHPIYGLLPKSVFPGKFDQVDALYEGLASIHIETINTIDPTYYPFLYQPVVEFALSFPTYELFKDGYDRFPLRKAVSDHFKTNTVWRRDKSQTTGIFQLGVKKNIEHLLDLCLEGHFVKKGLVDKEGLHKTIALIANGDTKNLWPFIQIVSTELFLKYWDEN